MNTKDRELMDNIRKTITEAKNVAIKDMQKTTDLNDICYYNGLHDAYSFVYEIIRKVR